MPGLYRSPGMADIDVCFGKRQAGTEAVKRRSQRYKDESAALQELMERPRRSVTLPLSGGHAEDEDEDARDIWLEEGSRPTEESQDVEMSDGSMHEGFGDRGPEETGLPPTPPEALNSNEPAEPQPLFADGVRNALSSQKSGALSTTPVNPQLSPPTPDTTPPARPQDADTPIRRQETPEAAAPLPVADERKRLQPPRLVSDFRAESYQTAHEDLPAHQGDETAEIILPDEDKLPEHWLDEAQNRPDFSGAENGVVDTDDHPVADAADDANRTISPTPPRTRYRFESPRIEREDTDWEKHISYVSGPDELDLADASEALPDVKEDIATPAGLGVSGVEMEECRRSAEDVNNSVYKQIQQDNIQRESAISSNSGAIRAGIVLPSADSTPKSVRRRKKCGSLRDGSGSMTEGKRHSEDSVDHVLKHERRHLPSRKALLEESPLLIRKRDPSLPSAGDALQVSSPGRLGSDALKQATWALASKTNPERVAAFGMPHTLKRQSHGERLSKNMSVRRTSLEVSPSDLEEAFNRIDRGAASVRQQRIPSSQRERLDSIQTADGARMPPSERPLQMNQGLKRKPPICDGRVELPLRKVIPSVTSEPESPSSPRQLRRFSREERLENNEHLRRPSDGLPVDENRRPSIGQAVNSEGQLANNNNQAGDLDRELSSEFAAKRSSHDPSVLSSPRKSMDARFLHPTTTPMSVSAFSDRTADIEVCEASGVRIYPHNNNSLLVVQQGSRPVTQDKQAPGAPILADIKGNTEPIFAAQIDPPTPVLGTSNPQAHVDSPLTNPRAAPQPPSIQFIPPTPNEEIDAQLGDAFPGSGTLTGEIHLPGRNLSFKQKVRRYSDSFFGRSTSFRRSRPIAPPPRDTHLSPMWRPQRFWDDDYDSEDDEYYYDDCDPDGDVLPPGGDTSHFDDDDEAGKKRALFPRAMSKRLPGFRGRGGFLQGNSLGIERHGTNNRRHYVSSGTRTLSRPASETLLRGLGGAHSANVSQPLPPRQVSSIESLDRMRQQGGFKVPFTGGMRAKWVGTRALREKMREARVARQERERERRREALKGRIGMRVYHG